MLHSLHDVFLDSLRLIERWILRQVSDSISWAPHHFALILLVQSCYYLHQRGLTSSVETDNTYLSSIEEAKIDIFEHLFLILLNGLAHSDHREYHFLVVYCSHRGILCLCLEHSVNVGSSLASVAHGEDDSSSTAHYVTTGKDSRNA